jgi:LysM repeat protein
MAIIKGGTAKVQKGDTLSAIAKATGSSVSAIAKANNIKNVNLIKPGQVFTIPKTPTKKVEQPVIQEPIVTQDPIITEEPPVSEGLTQEDLNAAIATALAGQSATSNAQMAILQQQIASLIASQTSSQNFAKEQAIIAAAEKAKQQEQQRVSTIAVLTERFQRYGLGSLVDKIKNLAIDGATESTITLALQESEEYKTRFKANQERIKKGLAVLTPAEYLNIEDGYRQVLRSYGLNQFDNDDYVQQFIANDVSPTELSNRVVTAVQRVQNADPAITQQLREYYGLGQPDLVAYVLDPNQQFQKIERQVAAAEIGVAAARQGLQAGVSVAEQLAAQGISQAEAQKGYATIADILPTAEKLSDIYGTTLDGYGQSEAEQEVFNSLASAQRKRQRLTARELAAFSGSSGVSRTSLTTSNVGQY